MSFKIVIYKGPFAIPLIFILNS